MNLIHGNLQYKIKLAATIREGTREREGKNHQVKKISRKPSKTLVASHRLTKSNQPRVWMVGNYPWNRWGKCGWRPEEHWVLNSERSAQNDHVICARMLDPSPDGNIWYSRWAKFCFFFNSWAFSWHQKNPVPAAEEIISQELAGKSTRKANRYGRPVWCMTRSRGNETTEVFSSTVLEGGRVPERASLVKKQEHENKCEEEMNSDPASVSLDTACEETVVVQKRGSCIPSQQRKGQRCASEKRNPFLGLWSQTGGVREP